MDVFSRVLFLVFMFLRFALLAQPYPMFVRFRFVSGLEYDIVSTDSFISVQSKEHAALKFPIPRECDRSTIRAVKKTPYITLRLECGEPETVISIPTTLISIPVVDRSSTNFPSDRSFSI